LDACATGTGGAYKLEGSGGVEGACKGGVGAVAGVEECGPDQQSGGVGGGQERRNKVKGLGAGGAGGGPTGAAAGGGGGEELNQGWAGAAETAGAPDADVAAGAGQAHGRQEVARSEGMGEERDESSRGESAAVHGEL